MLLYCLAGLFDNTSRPFVQTRYSCSRKIMKLLVFLSIQDKKYYPTAEEVYGPDVEVGVVNEQGIT